MTVATIALLGNPITFAFYSDAAAAAAAADKGDLFLVTKVEDLEALTGPQQVAVYNALAAELNATGDTLSTVTRFATKSDGARRIAASLEDLFNVHRNLERLRQQAQPPKRRPGTVNLQPKARLVPCKQGTKQALLVDLLARDKGASIAELQAALSGGRKPWTEASVRTGINWDVNAVKGYGIRTTHDKDGVARYHLTYPKGVTAPLPHTLNEEGRRVKAIREWAATDASRGAEMIRKVISDEELAAKFKTLGAAKRWAKEQADVKAAA